MQVQLYETFTNDIKQKIIEQLIEEGYGTYARRFQAYTFVIADKLNGRPNQIAMTDGEYIAINPSLLDYKSINGDETKMLEQLSVLIRHELLHSLLLHTARFLDLLKQAHPNDWMKYARNATLGQLSNYAADWDLSREGYDDHDKAVVKDMTINARVVGGLILEEDRPDLLDKPFEQIYLQLEREYTQNKQNAKTAQDQQNQNQQNQTTVNIKKTSHSPEYTKAYNDMILLSSSLSSTEIEDLLKDLAAGNTVFDSNGEALILQGE